MTTMTTANTMNPLALLFPYVTYPQRLTKQLHRINRDIEAEELRLISLQHTRAGILAQLDHLGVCSSSEDNKQYWPELT